MRRQRKQRHPADGISRLHLDPGAVGAARQQPGFCACGQRAQDLKCCIGRSAQIATSSHIDDRAIGMDAQALGWWRRLIINGRDFVQILRQQSRAHPAHFAIAQPDMQPLAIAAAAQRAHGFAGWHQVEQPPVDIRRCPHIDAALRLRIARLRDGQGARKQLNWQVFYCRKIQQTRFGGQV